MVAATTIAMAASGCGGGADGGNEVPTAASPPAEAVGAIDAAPYSTASDAADQPGEPPLRASGRFSAGSVVSSPITATATVVTASWSTADVAALGAGGYAVATQAGVHTFDGAGQRGGEFLVSLPPIRYQIGSGGPPYYEPVWVTLTQVTREAAIASSRGSYVAAWTGYARHRYDEFNRLYVTLGTPEGPLTLVADGAAQPDLAASEGGFMVVWVSGNPASSDVFAKVFSGSTAASYVRVNTVTAGSQWQPKVAALADGSYVVVWTSSGQDGSGTGIYGQRFDGSGNKVGLETRINSTTEGDQRSPAIAALNGGGYLVTWTSPDGDGTGVAGQRFDGGGNPAGGEVRINTTTAGDQGSATSMALGDGGYVVRWVSAGTGSLHSQYFNADGSPDGAEASSSPGTASSNIVMAALGDSRFAIAWSADRVYAQLFEDALVGTDGRDRLAATQRIHLLRGSGSDDRLEGSAGADTLDGGEGDDFMAGGAGDDTYIVESEKDKVLEHRGEGRDVVKSSITHALAREVEDLILTGSAPIDGSGNEKDNMIVGNGAANRLSGGAGSDTLDGSGGGDTFVFDTKPAADNIDTLKNFVASEDLIELDRRIFKGLDRGPLSAAAFAIGAAATTPHQRILFDPLTKALLYDPDGAGGQPAVQFATLEGVTGSLSAGNFVVN